LTLVGSDRMTERPRLPDEPLWRSQMSLLLMIVTTLLASLSAWRGQAGAPPAVLWYGGIVAASCHALLGWLMQTRPWASATVTHTALLGVQMLLEQLVMGAALCATGGTTSPLLGIYLLYIAIGSPPASWKERGARAVLSLLTVAGVSALGMETSTLASAPAFVGRIALATTPLAIFAVLAALALAAPAFYAARPPAANRPDKRPEDASPAATPDRAAVRWQAAIEEEGMHPLLDHVSDALVVLDSAWRVLALNPAAARLTGWSADKARGVPCRELFRCHNEQGLSLCESEDCPLWSLSRLSTEHAATVTFHRQDGQLVWVKLMCSQLPDPHGQPLLLCTLHDISEAKKLERLKSEFIAGVSHELRSPLTIIRGYSQILERALDEYEELRYYATTISEESRHLTRLVDDLLDFSRIETGRLRLNLEWCDLAAIVAETARTYEGYAQRHAIRTELPASPVIARADPARVRQVLTNLINNAIKYSPEGSPITIRLSTSERQRQQIAEIRVRDQGPGIAPEHQKRIFERFYRVNPSPAGGEGIGLGLAICKAIVEGHGGEIGVVSQVGQGSEFYFTLPLPPIVFEEDPDEALAAPFTIEDASSG
jgi:PAS domain S-box-containing protein